MLAVDQRARLRVATMIAAVMTVAAAVPSLGQSPTTSPSAARTPDTEGMTALGQTMVEVAAAVSPSVVTIVSLASGTGETLDGGIPTGVGSGVIIDPAGIILTNRHVVLDADSVMVALADGRQLDGQVAGVDSYTDLAFVRVTASDLPAAELGDSGDVQVGQLAIAIGSPLGRFAGSVSVGVVSGLRRSIEVADPMGTSVMPLRHLIQTDAAINPGNSGGALVDDQGRVIGINTAAAGMAQGIGFALPIDIAKPIIEQVLAGEPIARPWMGVQYVDVDAQLAAEESLPVTRGAWLVAPLGDAIVDGGPAAAAGLRDGDVIVAVDGQPITQEHPLDLRVLSLSPGTRVALTVLRDGEERRIELTLEARPTAD